jgi:tetratricopeptide (TPR) repeat protein
LGTLLRHQGKLEEAEALFREWLDGEGRQSPQDPRRLGNALYGLAATLLHAEKFAEAEPLARDLLALQESQPQRRDPWLKSHAEAVLGIALLGQKKFAEAEPLLASGYGGMTRHGDQRFVERSNRQREALQLVARLYGAFHRTDQVAEWTERLQEIARPGRAE